jgi:hypothetical protein
MPRQRLTRERIIQALNELGRRAEERALVLEVVLYGGAAMILAYSNREVTKDVDAILRPAEEGRGLAKDVAQCLGLDEDWLDEGIRKFLSLQGTFAPLEIEGLETAARQHLKITRASAGYLLAMKCRACRPELPGWPGDQADIEFLLRKMNLQTTDQVDEYIERFYPGDALDLRARPVVERILATIRAEQP